jgi:arylsulfatase
MEGGIRTPCVIRWPGRIPPGRTSNELVHEMDLFATFAAAAGITRLPDDRAMDSINILPFLEGKQAGSGRESALFFTGNQVRAVKWRDWKLHYAFMPEPRVTEPPLMRLFNLRSDPREETDIKDANPWAPAVFDHIVADYTRSLERFPNVPPNTKDPYQP